MGEVGSARYEPALLPSCPSIRVLSCSNYQEIHSCQQTSLLYRRLLIHSRRHSVPGLSLSRDQTLYHSSPIPSTHTYLVQLANLPKVYKYVVIQFLFPTYIELRGAEKHNPQMRKKAFSTKNCHLFSPNSFLLVCFLRIQTTRNMNVARLA